MTEEALPIAFELTYEKSTKSTSSQKLMSLAIAATFLSSFASHYNELKGIKLKDFSLGFEIRNEQKVFQKMRPGIQ
jgi:hypothetical protein